MQSEPLPAREWPQGASLLCGHQPLAPPKPPAPVVPYPAPNEGRLVQQAAAGLRGGGSLSVDQAE